MTITPSGYFELPVFAYRHRIDGRTRYILAHDEPEVRRMLAMLYQGMKGWEEPAAWEVGPILITMRFAVVMSALLRDLDKYMLVQTLRNAGVVNHDALIDGKWYACVAHETEEERDNGYRNPPPPDDIPDPAPDDDPGSDNPEAPGCVENEPKEGDAHA